MKMVKDVIQAWGSFLHVLLLLETEISMLYNHKQWRNIVYGRKQRN